MELSQKGQNISDFLVFYAKKQLILEIFETEGGGMAFFQMS